jgi:hypothetical protein
MMRWCNTSSLLAVVGLDRIKVVAVGQVVTKQLLASQYL